MPMSRTKDRIDNIPSTDQSGLLSLLANPTGSSSDDQYLAGLVGMPVCTRTRCEGTNARMDDVFVRVSGWGPVGITPRNGLQKD
jgi:hypothetical protein